MSSSAMSARRHGACALFYFHNFRNGGGGSQDALVLRVISATVAILMMMRCSLPRPCCRTRRPCRRLRHRHLLSLCRHLLAPSVSASARLSLATTASWTVPPQASAPPLRRVKPAWIPRSRWACPPTLCLARRSGQWDCTAAIQGRGADDGAQMPQ